MSISTVGFNGINWCKKHAVLTGTVNIARHGDSIMQNVFLYKTSTNEGSIFLF